MDLLIDRDDLTSCRAVATEPAPLEAGQARLRIDAFALTSNNVTYAVLGDLLHYWDAFPAESPWGRVPAWGYAEVVESRHAELEVGTRVYGFLPMSTELVVTPGKVGAGGFTDEAPHRAALAGAYNRYLRVEGASGTGTSPDEDQRMALYPLFLTAFLIDDFLGDNAFFGATTAVVSSASSKTALGAAFQIRRRGDVVLVGLTSPANRDFVAGLDVYDQVLGYDEIASSPAGPAVFLDVAGSEQVRADVHGRYRDELCHSMVVGASHWQDLAGDAAQLPGPSPEFFFAPTQIAKRSKEWGREVLDERLESAWRDVAAWTDGWMHFEHATGPAAAEQAYLRLLRNEADPRTAAILTLQE